MIRILFLKYLLVAFAITILCLTVYAAVQQTYRTSANDPQVQILLDVSNKIENSTSVEKYFTDTIVINKSLGTFITFFNYAGNPIRSSGILNEQLFSLPVGVFKNIPSGHHKEITSQPVKGLRFAMSVMHTKNQAIPFISVGRSLSLSEERQGSLALLVFLCWIILEGVATVYFLIIRRSNHILDNNTDA